MMLVNFYVVGYISPGWVATGIHILVFQWVLLSLSYSTPFHSVPYVMLWKAWNKGSAGLETLQLKQSSSCQLLPSTVHTIIVRPLVCERVWNKCGIRSLVIEASSFCHFFVSTALQLLNQLLWFAREFLALSQVFINIAFAKSFPFGKAKDVQLRTFWNSSAYKGHLPVPALFVSQCSVKWLLLVHSFQ